MTIEEKFQTIDKFYVGLTLVLVLMSLLLIFSFRGVFSMFLDASDYDPALVSLENSVQKDNLEEAYKFGFERKRTPLTALPEVKIEITPTP